MEKYKCNYHEALKIIAKDFGYISNAPVKKQAIKIQPKFEGDKQTFIQSEIKDFSEAELKWWGSFGVTKGIQHVLRKSFQKIHRYHIWRLSQFLL